MRAVFKTAFGRLNVNSGFCQFSKITTTLIRDKNLYTKTYHTQYKMNNNSLFKIIWLSNISILSVLLKRVVLTKFYTFFFYYKCIKNIEWDLPYFIKTSFRLILLDIVVYINDLVSINTYGIPIFCWIRYCQNVKGNLWRTGQEKHSFANMHMPDTI